MKKSMRTLITTLLGCLMISLPLGAAGESSPPPGKTLVLSLVGDCTIGEQEEYRGYGYSFTGRMKKLGMEYPFSHVAELFTADDITLANCEGVFTKRRQHEDKRTNLRATPEWAQVFSLGGVDVVNISNNHAYDYFPRGRVDTKNALTAVDVGFFGDGELWVGEVKGIKIGMTGYTYPHREDISRQVKDIKTLREMGCGLVIVSMHWGKELNPDPTGEQLKLGPALIDAGADIVYGHGPHVLQPIQIYKGKPIFYSLANFVFGADPNPKDSDTAVISLTYDLSSGEAVPARLEAIPMRMHKNKDYCPYAYTKEEDQTRVWDKLVFSEKASVSSGLPAGFAQTGIAVLLPGFE